MIDFKGTRLPVHGLAFKSANDCPHRDPDIARVLIYDDSRKTFIHVGTFQLQFLEQRWNTLKFKIPSCLTSAVLVDFENTNGASEIQLGEIIILN
jgi:hypothetical protein